MAKRKRVSGAVFYDVWFMVFDVLSVEDAGHLIKAISHHIKGKAYELPAHLTETAGEIFEKIDADRQAYNDKCDQLSANAKQRGANAEQMQSNCSPNGQQMQGNNNNNNNNNNNPLKGVYKENTKEKATKSRVFVPPTLEEVEAEIQAKGHHVDALEFFNYYDSQAWKKANGQRVSNWKGCLVTWDRKNRQNEKEQIQTQNSVTDWDKIAKEVEQLGYFDNVNNHADVFAGIPAAVREDVGG